MREDMLALAQQDLHQEIYHPARALAAKTPISLKVKHRPLTHQAREVEQAIQLLQVTVEILLAILPRQLLMSRLLLLDLRELI
jgi:hypothetical protein